MRSVRDMFDYGLATWLALTGVAAAEAADQDPSLGAVWSWALLGGSVAYMVCKHRAWLTLFVLPAAAFLPLVAVFGCETRNIESIIQGAVFSYCAQSALALLIAIVLGLSGAFRGGLRLWSAGAIIAGHRKSVARRVPGSHTEKDQLS